MTTNNLICYLAVAFALAIMVIDIDFNSAGHPIRHVVIAWLVIAAIFVGFNGLLDLTAPQYRLW